MNSCDAKHSVGSLVNQLRQEHENAQKACNANEPLFQIKMNKINQEIDRVVDTHNESKIPLVSYSEKGHAESSAVRYDQYLRKGFVHEGMTVNENGSVSIPLSKRSGLANYYGAYSIADHVHDSLARSSVIRQLSSKVVISKESFDMVATNGDVGTQWSDGSAVAPVSSTFERKIIKTHDLNAQPRVTQKMIDDADIDLEQWVANKLSVSFLIKENEAFLKGDGVNQPKGILTYASGTGNGQIERVKSGNATNFTVDSLMSLYYSLSDIYAPSASFVMHKSVAQNIRTFKDNLGQYLWHPGILSGKPDTLIGVPLYTTNSMPTVASNNDVIVYGDFAQAYQIVDRGDLLIQRDPFSSKPFVVFFATKRVGGDVVNTNALSILRIAA